MGQPPPFFFFKKTQNIREPFEEKRGILSFLPRLPMLWPFEKERYLFSVPKNIKSRGKKRKSIEGPPLDP